MSKKELTEPQKKVRNKKYLMNVFGALIAYAFLVEYVGQGFAIAIMLIASIMLLKYYNSDKYFEIKNKLMKKEGE